MMKAIVKKILLFGLLVFLLGPVFTTPTFAAGSSQSDDSSCRSFLGMYSWDCNVKLDDIDSTDDLKESIWMIVANISSDATVLAAYLALGFIIYGGYRYIFSGGDPGKVASGKKTLTTAFIGLGIVLLANVIFNGIKFALLSNGASDLSNVDASNVVTSAISWAVGMGGVAAAIFLVYGGISYMTSSGDSGKLAKAKNTIIYALIGLAIVGLAELILAFVSNQIRKGAENAQFNNEIIAIIEEENEK